MIRIAALVLLASVSAQPALAQTPVVASDSYRPERYAHQPDALFRESLAQDLRVLETMFLGANLSFDTVPGSRERFREEVAALRARLPHLTYAQFAMGVAKTVAVVDDGHTAANLDGLRLSPVRLLWFGDELRVVMVRHGQEALLGARITAVNGTPVGEVLRAMGAYIPGSDERVRARSVRLFASPDALFGMGIGESGDHLALTVERMDGTQATVTLAADAAAPPPARPMPWQDAIPEHMLRPAGWTHLLDGATDLPTYLRDGDRLYGADRLPGMDDVFYYRARMMRDQDVAWRDAGAQLRATAIPLRDDLMDALGAMAERATPYAHAIIDLRYNPGGNYFNALEFARNLPRTLAPGGRIFIVTNNDTFSAAIVATALLKYHGGSRATIVGERVGDREQFWAENYGLVLPGSGLRIGAARGYHDWATGCSKTAVPCWGINRLLSVPAGSLTPTLPVVSSFEDYRNRRDPAIAAIRAALGR